MNKYLSNLGLQKSGMESFIMREKTVIDNQLGRIFADAHFMESDILKRFLSFIVHETLLGRSNCLKEYTIAVNVLGKPASFKPQENGIVRIHAGRLRRALSQYYNEKGIDDDIVITIPKGKYVPVFADRRYTSLQARHDNEPVLSTTTDKKNDIVLAILPFNFQKNEEHIISLAEGLCLQMSSMLSQLTHISAIAYLAMKNLVTIHPDLRELSKVAGLTHAITGGVQNLKDQVRINIELVECSSYRQLWSETYERQLTKSNPFKLQDEICQHVFNKVVELDHKKYEEETTLSYLMSVK